MARASRMVRKLRKVKRERTLAFRMVDAAILQLKQARAVAGFLEQELKKRDAQVNESAVEGEIIPGTNSVASQLGLNEVVNE